MEIYQFSMWSLKIHKNKIESEEKKMLKKKLFATGLATIMMAELMMVPTNNVFAQEGKYVDEKDIFVIESSELERPTIEENIKPSFVNDFRNRKKNVRTYNEWSPFKRVSDNIHTGNAGGSISSNKSVTFGCSVSGNINGLYISTNGSVSSSIGYTLNVGKNKRVYMGYRVYYKVEKGINEYYDIVTGKVIRSNSYTVKTPQYGEYKLINY